MFLVTVDLIAFLYRHIRTHIYGFVNFNNIDLRKAPAVTTPADAGTGFRIVNGAVGSAQEEALILIEELAGIPVKLDRLVSATIQKTMHLILVADKKCGCVAVLPRERKTVTLPAIDKHCTITNGLKSV